MRKPRLLVFASGTANGGGSGFEKLVEAQQRGDLAAEIVRIISNDDWGGVAEKAMRLGHTTPKLPGPLLERASVSGSDV